MSDDIYPTRLPVVIYVLRPNGEAIWLPEEILDSIGAQHRDRLTEEQFRSNRVQEVIAARLQPRASK